VCLHYAPVDGRFDRASCALTARLAGRGNRPALVHAGATITYGELAERIARRVTELGDGRRLVAVRAASSVDAVVDYLAAMAGGNAVLLLGPRGTGDTHDDELLRRYEPDVVVETPGCGVDMTAPPRHVLHPSLALLLSTSGSTGSPKLVRISHTNLAANAEGIAASLGLREDDRAITSLPMHYCYGLSVINSHLAVGASVVLADHSVTDDRFWDSVRADGVTNFAGVPYTFEQLDRIGFDQMHLPSLRFVTQAGGRLAPERVRRYAELGRKRGWELFVMYGQTEATARMACTPPGAAHGSPGTIGVPVPGGSFRLDGPGPDGVGELVYCGPNVMLGYATVAGDLARGRDVTELRTGDLARRHDDGAYEIVGRCSRIAKIFGLRIDLDQVERAAAEIGVIATVTGDDQQLYVAVPAGTDTRRVRDHLASRAALPRRCVLVAATAVPRLASGKPDYAGLRAHIRSSSSSADEREVRRLFASVLQVDAVCDEDTFVSLGGDSLSYVELSTRLDAIVGDLPRDWHVVPVGALQRRAESAPARAGDGASMETSVVLRAASILLVVATHVGLFRLQGGAHVLLALAGFNFARFQLHPGASAPRRLRSISKIAVPSALMIGAFAALGAPYDLSNVLLLHGFVGSDAWTEQWRYWFVEALVQILVASTLLFTVAPVRRLERAQPFWFATGLLAVGLALREVLGSSTVHAIYRPHTVLWVFVLGWAAQRARTDAHRLLVSALALLAVPGTFGEGAREAVIVAGLLLLVWVPRVRVPRPATVAIATVATASLFIYLTHPHVYPAVVERTSAGWGLAASLVVGVAASELFTRLRLQPVRSAAWPAWRSSHANTEGSIVGRSRTSSASSGRGGSSPT
jgi:acyl-CoA synthetase (AMP-forming)/AMP-acid ligase II